MYSNDWLFDDILDRLIGVILKGGFTARYHTRGAVKHRYAYVRFISQSLALPCKS